jgi:hypothetical protein
MKQVRVRLFLTGIFCSTVFSLIGQSGINTMNNTALNDEIEKDVLPWLRLAEDLRVLQLDVEVRILAS